ncbi:MAG: hypothetical protein K8T90_15120 [Planctomycetes bacterium]|nr:hypothetical protein [Planctomycetota bacterium]
MNRTVVALIAALTVALLVATIAYTVGEILREQHPIPRDWALVSFAVALVVCLCVLLVAWLVRRSKAAGLEDGLAAGSGRDSRGEIEALRKQWKESVAKLRGTAVAGGGGRALAALPWYLIIGAPASGKSTLLRQSGIDFPVGDAAIRGLQGTRNCDWWFSNIGVFLDTAGRYISDESAEEWAQFLDLVRRHRTGAPVNGVIVAIPASDLVERSFEDQDLEARRIRARLDELIDHLGVNFPVWIVLTKVDLVGGFAEYFGGLDAAQRAQMMGWTLDQGEGARYDASDFERRFRLMVHRLRELRPELVAKAALRDRPAAYAFPDEVSGLGDPLNRMLQRIFEPNVYQEMPLLRGVYVTSATQVGTPLQRAATRVRELLGAPRVDADAMGNQIRNAYFVRDLMHERIVRDQGMTWTTQREVERGRTKRLGLNLIGASFGVLALLTIVAFGLAASRELAVIETHVDEVAAGKGGSASKCDALWRAASLATDDNRRNLGLSQQKSLRLDLQEKQREVYVEKVLRPLVDGYRKDAEGVDVKAGVASIAAVEREFRLVEAALRHAADPEAKADPASPDDEEDETPAPADGKKDEPKSAAVAPADHAPKGFFPKDQVAAFEARADRLRTDGVLGKKRKKADPGVGILLDVVWRNRGLPDEVTAEIQAVHDAFRRKAAEYCKAAGAAVDRIEGDAASRASYAAQRRDNFIATCRRVLDQVLAAPAEADDLRRAIGTLADAADGGGAVAGPSALDAAQRALLDGIAASLAALGAGDRPLVADADLAAWDGVASMRRWIDVGATKPAPGAPGTGEAASRAALNAVSKELRRLADSVPAMTARPWTAERAQSIRDALAAMDARVSEGQREWLSRVQPHLVALSGAETPEAYRADERRSGLAVELIEPMIRRNVLYRFFVEEDEDGTFRRLARWKVVKNRDDDGEYSRASLTYDLTQLLSAHAWGEGAEPSRFVAPSSRTAAAKAAVSAFKLIADKARNVWDERVRRIARYSATDRWVHLARWVQPGGQVSKLSAELAAAWGEFQLDGSLRGTVSEPVAREAWALVEPLRPRYEFFLDRYPDVVATVAPLYAREGWQPQAGGLDKLAGELGVAGGRPVWWPREVGATAADAPDTAARKDLLDAIGDCEDEVVRRVEQHFRARWEPIRKDLQAAVSDASPERAATAQRDFAALTTDLAALFGPDLALEPGRRMRVGASFRAVRGNLRTSLELRNEITRGMDFTFTCRRVPYRENEQEGVRLPYIQLEYQEDGGREAQRQIWKTSGTETWRVRWAPGRGSHFRISMVSEKGDRRAVFVDWTGPSCLIDALASGKGGLASLTWEGRGEYATSVPATFQVEASDPDLLRQIMNPQKPAAGARFDGDCVEIVERR